MMPTLNHLLAMWHARPPREQMLLSVLGALLIGLGYWLLVLAPARAGAQAARDRYVAASESLMEVEAGVARISGLSGVAANTGPGNAGSLRAELARSAEAAGLKITRLQPDNDGAVAVWLEPAPPPAVFAWIGGLYRDGGISVKRLSLAKGENGLAQAQIAFGPPGGK